MSIHEKMLNTYNDLTSNYTSEELEELKNIIIKNQNNSNIDGNNLISIRILSQQECNKYLISNSLNGSITENNDNVWHYDATPKKAYLRDEGQGIVKFTTNEVPSPWRNNVENINNISGPNKNVNVYAFACCTQSHNANNQTFIFIQKPQIVYACIYITGNSSSDFEKHAKAVSINSGYIEKTNSTVYAKSENVNAQRTYNQRQYVIINYYYNSSFRPIFQYIDNNKSINIFK